MIDLYYAPTPNGWKVAIMLEELAAPYQLHLMQLTKGDQFQPDFLAISPNAKMPAIVDHAPVDGGDPQTLFESGAILHYLATKTQQFWPQDPRLQIQCLEWLFWQVGNQGPMMGQLSHFRNYAPEEHKPYGLKRYLGETERCLAVLERRLDGREWMVGDAYSVADMICFPWAFITRHLGGDLSQFPNVQRWREAIKQRPAVRRAIDLGKNQAQHGETANTNSVLFNQNAGHLLKR